MSFKGQYQSDKTLPCPFCGEQPIIVPWHGGGPKKRRVFCYSDVCVIQPAACESTEAKAIRAWNTRA